MQMSSQDSFDYVGIKFLKFAQVSVMLIAHAVIWTLTFDRQNSGEAYTLLDYLTVHLKVFGFISLSIPITSGVLLCHSLQDYIVDHRLLNYPLKRSVIFLAGLGIAETVINTLSSGLAHAFDWDVLKFIGVAFAMTVILARLSVYALIPGIAGILFATGPLTEYLSGTTRYWTEALVGANSSREFYWPLLPWSATVMLGFLLQFCYLRAKNRSRALIYIAGSGLSLLAYYFVFVESAVSFAPEAAWQQMYQPAFGLMIGLIGVYLTMFAGCILIGHYYVPRQYGIIDSYAQGMLLIYGIYSVVGYWIAGLLKPVLHLNLFFALMIFTPFSLLLSWMIGLLSIKLLKEKSYVVRFRRG